MTVGTTRLRFVEETDASAAAVFGARDREDRADDAAEAIAERLADGARASKDVKTSVMAELGCSARTVIRAAKHMEQCGELIISESGFPRRTTWAMASGDTPVVTPPDTPRVTTERNGAVEPNHGGANSSGDTTGSQGVSPLGTAKIDVDAEREFAQGDFEIWEGR